MIDEVQRDPEGIFLELDEQVLRLWEANLVVQARTAKFDAQFAGV